jgi:Zn-finger domain-containing protein
LVIFFDDKVDYCEITTDNSEISPMIRTTKSEFNTIKENNGWIELKDKQEQKQIEGLVKLYKVRGQSFGICAIYSGDNVQWTTTIDDIPQNWSTTLRTTFGDQWKDNLEEDINTAFSMFAGNIE